VSFLNDYLLSCRKDEPIWFADRITCKDGFSLSVQVHYGAYCSPRDGMGPVWTHAEIGFPSDEPNKAVMAYAENPSDPTQTVYPYVPMILIEQLIIEHGGMAEEEK
jgi:hypothetical protein